MTTVGAASRIEPGARALELAGEAAFEVAARARRLEAQGRRVVHLEIGDPGVPTPPHVVEAGIAALRAGETGYCAPPGLPELREAIAATLRGRGVPASAERVVVTAGGKPALFYALLAVLEPGDEVLLPDPGFPAFSAVARFAGATVVTYPLARERGFGLDAGLIAERLTSRSRVVIVNAPHNPSGGGASLRELERLAELAERRDLIVISDEVYARIAYDGPQASIAELPGLTTRTLVVDTFSKTYAMPGWRLGYLLAPADLVGAIVRLLINNTSCTPPFVQRAGLAALTGPQQGVDQLVRRLRARRDVLVRGLNAIPGIRCDAPAGAFLAFPDVTAVLSRIDLTTEAFAEALLERHGVATLPGTAFGPGGAGHLRLSFAASEADLELALAALRRAAGAEGTA
jgi:aspartate/methionine/tyrosine aminotransferase